MSQVPMTSISNRERAGNLQPHHNMKLIFQTFILKFNAKEGVCRLIQMRCAQTLDLVKPNLTCSEIE